MPLKDPAARKAYNAAHFQRNKKAYRNSIIRTVYKAELPMREPGLTCECCGRLFTEVKGVRREACFDHDHKTGAFRGWICHRCNLALGFVEDSRDRLQLLIQYLDRHELLK